MRRIEELVAEAQRVLAICNACRYCEGYCAVFPALERRLSFDEGDVHYLASLCHNCGSCLYACQYAPPHEFQLNFPRLLAQVRMQTYRRHAWPAFLGAAFERGGALAAVATALGIAMVLALTLAITAPGALTHAHPDSGGSFYALLPHGVLVTVFGLAFAFALASLVISALSFWVGTGEAPLGWASPPALGNATWDAAGLRYLDGGGDGCTYPGEKPSFARRTYHHFTFYGFMLCFAATSVATIYHYVFGIRAPYPVWSLPVLLGIAGGVGLLVGPAGLLWLKARRDPHLADRAQDGMDVGFILLLMLVSATGLALLALRETGAMGWMLVIHLGAVLALFVTLPYGKFVHAAYRSAALVRFHVERRRPLPDIASE